MAKLKLIFSLLFLLVFQQAYCAPLLSDKNFSVQKSDGIESSFESNDSFPGIFGDVPAGRIVVTSFLSEVECDPGISKSKVVLSGLTFSVTKSNLEFFIAQTSVFTRYSAVYIPIYLQTASFLL